MTRYQHLTEQDRILLSAYLDGELSEKESARISELLESSSEAALQLKSLRNVKAVLKLLPEHAVPHNFTLTHLEAQAAKPGLVFMIMRLVSGISAAALAVVLAFDFLIPIQSIPMAAKMTEDFALEEMPQAEMAQEAPAAKAQQPPVIEWYPASPPGFGIGGGGAGDGIPAGPQGPVLPDISLQPGEILPVPSTTDQAAESLEMEAAPMEAQAEENMDAEKQGVNSGPILGVRPADQQGQTVGGQVALPPVRQLSPEVEQEPSLWIIEIGLLSLSIISAIIAVFLRRKKRAH